LRIACSPTPAVAISARMSLIIAVLIAVRRVSPSRGMMCTSSAEA
jgi:hypothetical protein